MIRLLAPPRQCQRRPGGVGLRHFASGGLTQKVKVSRIGTSGVIHGQTNEKTETGSIARTIKPYTDIIRLTKPTGTYLLLIPGCKFVPCVDSR